MSDLPQALQVAAGRWLEPLAAASRDGAYRRDLFVALGLDADAFDDNGVARLAVELGRAADALDALVALDLDEASLETVALVLDGAQAGVAAAESAAAIAADLDDTVGDALAVLERLFGLLTIGYLASYAPAAFDVAALLTLIRVEERPDGARPRLELGRLPAILGDPESLVQEYLGPQGLDSLQTPADAVMAADRLLPRVAAVARHTPVNARYSRDLRLPLPTDTGVADRRLTLELPIGPGIGAGLIVTIRSAQEGGPDFLVAPFGAVRVDQEGLGWVLTLDVDGTVPGLAVGRGGVEFPAGTAVPRLSARAAARKRQGPGGLAFRTSATGSRLEIGRVELKFGAEFADDYEIEALLAFDKAALVVTGGDGLLQQILPPEGLRAEFDLGIGWSRRKGLFFRGSAGLDATLPLHVVLGPLTIQSIHLALRATDRLSGELSATADLRLGPVRASVERMGLQTALTFPPGGGNLGPADALLAFKPPAGAALSIDAGAVTGGGFLSFDPVNEQYAGGLHLEIGDLTLNAIGLLTTRMPDGSPGFSLLVIVQASGFAPVQLGLGFTLNGVGGLLGINRTVASEVLRAGVRNRTLDAILFSPDDPTPRAPQIISTLQSVFPPARDRHLFGPMVLIGWGSPRPVLTLELALVLELMAPVRLMLLGRLRATLPERVEGEKALVEINMDAFGLIDLDRQEASVDATLYDSTIGPFALTGDMALRAGWGEQPTFILAIGGFHPAFSPPPGLPALRRLAIALSTADNPRLRAEAYLAITSNTVQIGAGLELYAEALGFALEGGFSFDALLHLSPFRFQVDIHARLVLKRGASTLMGLDVAVHLDGPNPWHVNGTATFTLLFLSVTVNFEATFGEASQIAPRERVDVWAQLEPELRNTRNWTAALPADSGRLVALRTEDEGALLHPLGTASVSQRIVPLGRQITRFGAAEPLGARRFEITAVTGLSLQEDTFEHFAPAQFFELSDAEKLSAPSFDRMPSGRRVLGDAAVTHGAQKVAPLTYETIVVEDEARERQKPPPPPASEPAPPPELYTPTSAVLASLVEVGAAAGAAVRTTGRERFRSREDPAIAVSEERYAVAGADVLLAEADGVQSDGSYSAAREALIARVDAAPERAGDLQIVGARELMPV